MSAQAYLQDAIATLTRLAESQREPLSRAADLLVETIRNSGAIFSFGASHSFILTEELVYRTGGLMLINPIHPHGMNLFVRPMTLTSELERVPGLGRVLFDGSPARKGDVVLIASTSGRNPVVIDLALRASEKGVRRVGITSLAYAQSVTSRHASGKKLHELCDVVLDNGAPAGDACVRVPGVAQPVGPLSTVTGCALVNALVAEVVSRLAASGIEPPVYMSANLDGGDAYNARQLARCRDRVHYL
ncbi:MAG: SIS domain-containing protein [Kiritimatiellae bacterium]|nr:SIS domain-containing protein [Kiritimatiellia bacterium]